MNQNKEKETISNKKIVYLRQKHKAFKVKNSKTESIQ